MDSAVLAHTGEPFSRDGGLKLLDGNLGRAIIKTSAIKPEHRLVQAPAMVFNSQDQLLAAFKAGNMDRDLVAVVRYQGPRANGMPELHKLTPCLGKPEGIGPPGTKITGRCPKVKAPISRPGTILSHTPRQSTPSNILWERAIEHDIAITSLLKSESSMPG